MSKKFLLRDHLFGWKSLAQKQTKNKNNKYKLNHATLTWKTKPKENRLKVNLNVTLNEIAFLPPLYDYSTFLSQGHEQ